MDHKEIARAIAASAQKAGYKALVVGGFVRDMVMGHGPNDLDIELYNSGSVEKAIAFAESIADGGKVDALGKPFGILSFRFGGVDIDLSLPRRENKVGRGHKGFLVEPDPTMTPMEAASRRDFTFNALSWNPLTDEILDFWGGVRDATSRLLRHTTAYFVQDPLRVLRGMQFCGRKCLVAHGDTVNLCRALLPEYEDLSLERIWYEWQKWAEKSIVPSAGLQFLRRTKWLSLYPALNDMVECAQAVSHHPEGTAWDHTLYAVNAMADICADRGIEGEDKAVLIFAALLHDVGKPLTSEYNEEKGRITAYGHDKAGGPIAREFLESIGAPEHIIERVVPLVEGHMRHVNFHTGGTVSKRHARRLAKDLHPATIEEWAMVVEADMNARPPLDGGLPEAAQEILAFAEELRIADSKPKPILMGRHLIEMCWAPGPEFGSILDAAYEAQLDGEFDDVQSAIEWLKEDK